MLTNTYDLADFEHFEASAWGAPRRMTPAVYIYKSGRGVVIPAELTFARSCFLMVNPKNAFVVAIRFSRGGDRAVSANGKMQFKVKVPGSVFPGLPLGTHDVQWSQPDPKTLIIDASGIGAK
jgi:hypothetical protein